MNSNFSSRSRNNSKFYITRFMRLSFQV